MFKNILIVLSIIAVLTSCNNQFKAKPGEAPKATDERRDESFGKLSGEEGLVFGGKKKRDTAGITVNAFLWRAALEAVNTLPIQLVDPFSGVITSDWYHVNNSPNRYKMNIIINSDTIRADAVKVNVFTQKHTGQGWIDVPTNPQMGIEVENRILTRARFLKVNN